MPPQTAFQVGPDTVVHFSYRLYDAEGECVEGSAETVFSFLCGYGQLAPALENAMLGLQVGQSRRIKLSPEQAFGSRDPARILELDPEGFPPDIAAGDEFEAENDSGESVSLLVLDVDAERVVIDTNHPLAGQRVEVLVAIEAVRPALAAEIEEAAAVLSGQAEIAQGLLPAARLLRRPSEADGDEPEPEASSE